MVVIGIDPHKRTHTAVAIDHGERVLDERLVHATGTQGPELLEWAKRLDGGERVWAIESAGGLGYLLAQPGGENLCQATIRDWRAGHQSPPHRAQKDPLTSSKV